MRLKGLEDVDFVNYKVASMFLITTKCNFKCDKECGKAVCQNLPLASAPVVEISNAKLVERYLKNDMTHAVVIGGLEPFDSWFDTYDFINEFRKKCDDDIVIYTGYYENEIELYRDVLNNEFKNIILKTGRYIPNQKPHYDEVLGVMLASDNQKGVKIC